MANALGYVEATERGYAGVLAMLHLKTKIEIIENAKKTGGQPNYRIYAGAGCEIGGAWIRKSKSSGKDYLSLTLSNPHIGPRKIYANMAPVKGEDGKFVILWNPEN